MANKDLANQANYRLDLTRYAVTGTTTALNFNSNQNILTDVGAYTSSSSYYGAFDMSGNTWDWNDLDGTPGANRGVRGGAWNSPAVGTLSSTTRVDQFTTDQFVSFGFRLVGPVPEPATLGIALGGVMVAGGWWMLKRRRRART